MRESGVGFISILFSLVIIAFLTLMLIKNLGVDKSHIQDAQDGRDPREKAKAIECTLKVDALNKEVTTYKITNEKFPATLGEITSDYLCPICNAPFSYDPTSGKVWCQTHKDD